MRWGKDKQNVEKWHDWYAWHPVECEGEKVWLEYIQRRWVWNRKDWELSDWEYRFHGPINTVYSDPLWQPLVP